jgi:predicted chitinase
MHYTGVVENRMDPLKLGRCQVRIHGLHTHDKSILPTNDLPWAYPMQSLRSAAMNGIGDSPNGVVEGTVVVIIFMDRDQQQPVMIGTVGGIPQDEGRVDNDQAPLMFNESKVLEPPQQVPVTSPNGSVVASSDGTVVTTNTTSNAPATTTIPGNNLGTRDGSNVNIPNVCHRGIQAVAAAMDSAGITAPYARAAILGIIGGECDWVPQKEAFGYSRSRIKEVFSWMSDADADTYATWKGTREDFFRFVYGPNTRSGKNLGNKDPDDGALYYGRGFIQLTGASNYKRYAKLSGVDIVSNPDLLNDYEQGAKVIVAYFKDRVKVAENDPAYFDAACAAVGYNVPNIKAKKQAYYQYFLLADQNASKYPQETRNTGVPGSQPTTVKPSSQTGLPVDRQKNVILGFRDPHMKYPLRDKLNEPDTNRLARGRVEGTSVQTRDNTRTMHVPTADGSNWNQPPVPYNAKYPFNRVYESESGHLQEFDDTPDNERINLQHRSGTFTEVDCNGTRVNRIVGDGYDIIDRNGYIYVRGATPLRLKVSQRFLLMPMHMSEWLGTLKSIVNKTWTLTYLETSTSISVMTGISPLVAAKTRWWLETIRGTSMGTIL